MFILLHLLPQKKMYQASVSHQGLGQAHPEADSTDSTGLQQHNTKWFPDYAQNAVV